MIYIEFLSFFSFRLAWERVLTASVILGYCSNGPLDAPLLSLEQDSSLLSLKVSQDGVRELLVISRLLCQTHMGRYRGAVLGVIVRVQGAVIARQ